MITLDVEYVPEVEVTQMYYHSAEGRPVRDIHDRKYCTIRKLIYNYLNIKGKLVCNVHAHPPATVHWFKNTDM